MKSKAYLLLLLITISGTSIFAHKSNSKIFHNTFQWKPETGKNGCDATVDFKLNYYLENDDPYVAVSVNIEKENTVYFEGNQYSRAELGEKAYNAIRVGEPRFVVDIYDGGKFITSIGYGTGQGSMIYGGHWLTIFEGHIHKEHTSRTIPSWDRSKEIFLSNSFEIKNMRLTYLDAVNFHLVKMYALDSGKTNSKNE